MREQTFVKTRKNLAILLLSSFLILGAIPLVAVAAYESDTEWAVYAYHHFYIFETDVDNLREVLNTDNWQTSSEYSKYTDRMYTDSQEAINWSESYNTTYKLDRAKEEFKKAMEQAGQAGISIKKCIEANITGNTADEDAYCQKFNESWKSYLLHKTNVYDLTRTI